MTILDAMLLFIAALVAGGLNSVAGGGSFISFPTLTFVGVPLIPANATNTIALWPGSVASVGAYRKELSKQNRTVVIVLSICSLIGGLLGAILLIRTPPQTFAMLLPFLLLVATLLFTFGGSVTKKLRERFNAKDISDPASSTPGIAMLVMIAGIQLVIATYGGYFGGGIGILMLASFALMGMQNIHTMNGLKTLMASFINGVAVVAFVINGLIVWPQAVVMICGAIIGGYSGAALAQKLNPKLVRRFVILVGFTMTAFFFYRTYLAG